MSVPTPLKLDLDTLYMIVGLLISPMLRSIYGFSWHSPQARLHEIDWAGHEKIL